MCPGPALPVSASVDRRCRNLCRTAPRRGGAKLTLVDALKAHVRDGRIVLDKPSELEEGAALRALGDDTDAEDRAELNAMLDESFQQLDADDTIDGPT